MKTRKYTWCDWLSLFVWIIVIVLILYITISEIVLYSNKKEFEPKTKTAYIMLSDDIEPVTTSKKEIIKVVRDYYDTPFILFERDLSNKKYLGKANPIYRFIVIEKTLQGYQLIITLAHEICHLKYFTANDAYAEFMAFKTLYESGNQMLINASYYMIDIHCGSDEYIGTRYDISGHIQEYLIEE